MNNCEKKRIEYSEWLKWREEMESLSWNDSDRSQILCLLLDTYNMKFINAIEDILNSDREGVFEDMEELITTIRDRRKSIVNG
jgi:hypothetical protein